MTNISDLTPSYADSASFRKARFSWMMFDWSCSPISALHTTFVFAVYFTTVVMPEGGSFAWSQMTAATALLIGITAPFIGRLADNTGQLKPFLFVCLLGASLATAGLWFVTPDNSAIWLALCLSSLSIFTIETAFIFYNAMLSSLAQPHKQGRLSGTAWGLGYIGAILSLVLVLVFLILPDTPLFGLEKATSEPVRATMVFAGLWAFIFGLPLFFFVRTPPAQPPSEPFFAQMLQTIRTAQKIAYLMRFLVARMLFNDGLITLFAFGGIFAARIFGFSKTEILIFAIGLNLTAGIGAYCGGMITDKLGVPKTIRLSLWGLIIIGIICISAPTKEVFWISGLSLGLFIGPCQSASRVWVSLVAPEEDRASLFGLLMMSGKLTSFFGPLFYGWLVLASGTDRIGMLIVPLLLGAGLVLMPRRLTPPTDS
ncbi:MAG: MFS transporter [Alphaproteobacteria bacterium]|nr:MFS transporter [Alphaproteobacteria bacterium]